MSDLVRPAEQCCNLGIKVGAWRTPPSQARGGYPPLQMNTNVFKILENLCPATIQHLILAQH